MTSPNAQWNQEELEELCGSRHLKLLFAFTAVVIAIVGGAIGLVMMQDSAFHSASNQWQQAAEVRIRMLEQQNVRIEERLSAMMEILKRIDTSHPVKSRPALTDKEPLLPGMVERIGRPRE